MMNSRTMHVQIACPVDEVYRFASNAENMPRWATSFCLSVRKSDSDWVMETTSGPIQVRFAPVNEFGVLDHVVTLPDGRSVLVPMRVVPNGEGSEVALTLFQLPGMSDEQFDKDAAMVEADLQTLKTVLAPS